MRSQWEQEYARLEIELYNKLVGIPRFAAAGQQRATRKISERGGKLVLVKVAGIDCGTNSIRLLIGSVDAKQGKITDELRRMEIVRLGAGVDSTGRFAPAALARTLDAVADYAAECRRRKVESIRFAATSATRDAENREEFIAGVYRRLGVYPQVLSGEQEATFSFQGALSALPIAEIPPRLLTVDLGGGSTEFTLGTAAGEVQAAVSMNIGSVRMRERHLHSDPPTAAEIAAARADVQRALDTVEAKIDFTAAAAVIGLAGTVTSLTAFALQLPNYDPARIHGSALRIAEISAAAEWFLQATPAERRQLGFLHPGRVDVIAAGALVWQEIVRRIAARTADSATPVREIITSEHDILDGLALWAARQPQKPARI